MKTKTILTISIATNVVLLTALAYLQSLSSEPLHSPPVIFVINSASPETVDAVAHAAEIVENALP